MTYQVHTHGRTEPFTIDGKDILLNDPQLPWEYNPHRIKLWLIGDETGPLACVWASGASDALDALVDADRGDNILIDEEDMDDYKNDQGEYDVAYLGNAGEPGDLEHAWIEEVSFVPARDYRLLCAIAYGMGAGLDTLD